MTYCDLRINGIWEHRCLLQRGGGNAFQVILPWRNHVSKAKCWKVETSTCPKNFSITLETAPRFPIFLSHVVVTSGLKDIFFGIAQPVWVSPPWFRSLLGIKSTVLKTIFESCSPQLKLHSNARCHFPLSSLINRSNLKGKKAINCSISLCYEIGTVKFYCSHRFWSKKKLTFA